jgi:predicted HTH domain antitoxin
MSNLTVSLSLPRNLLGTLDIPEAQLAGQILELLALELFRQGKISTGKGAELLGIAKSDFIEILARHQIAYLTTTPAELEAEVANVEALMQRSHQ